MFNLNHNFEIGLGTLSLASHWMIETLSLPLVTQFTQSGSGQGLQQLYKPSVVCTSGTSGDREDVVVKTESSCQNKLDSPTHFMMSAACTSSFIMWQT